MTLDLQTTVLIAVSLGQILLAVDRWVHSRESKAGTLAEVEKAVRVAWDVEERLRVERARLVAHQFDEADRRVETLADRVDGHGERLRTVEAEIVNLWRRTSFGPRPSSKERV